MCKLFKNSKIYLMHVARICLISLHLVKQSLTFNIAHMTELLFEAYTDCSASTFSISAVVSFLVLELLL